MPARAPRTPVPAQGTEQDNAHLTRIDGFTNIILIDEEHLPCPHICAAGIAIRD